MNNNQLQFFKTHAIPITWATLVIGRKLGLAAHNLIEAYATEYMQNNSTVSLAVNELAYGVPDTYQGNITINELLENIIKETGLPLPLKNSDSWYQEIRKWRFMLLNEAVTDANHNDLKLHDALEKISCTFEHPYELEVLLGRRDDQELDEAYKKLNTLTEQVAFFLKNELQEINKAR